MFPSTLKMLNRKFRIALKQFRNKSNDEFCMINYVPELQLGQKQTKSNF